MRILIFGHTAFYNTKLSIEETSKGGGWMDTLILELQNHKEIHLGLADGCATIDYKGKMLRKDCQHGMEYYHWPYHTKKLKDKILDFIHYKDASRDEKIWPYYLNIYKQVINDFRPDVIHIFGSEVYLQLAAISAKGYSAILHAQGLLSVYKYLLLPPGFSRWNYILKDGIRMSYANFQDLVSWERGAYREKAILRSISHVLGRTEWDKNMLELLAPQAKYHYGGELLRPIFYETSHRIIPDKPVIMTTLSSPLYKGYDLILKVADILKNHLNIDFEWKVYGGPNAKFIERHLGIDHNKVNVKICGRVTAEQIKETICSSTVYFQSSYIENSPNSLAEAQICGLPVVASNVGGTSSMVEHGKTGFLYIVTDPYSAAYYIQKLCNSRELNISMGENAMKEARRRHNVNNIVNELIDCYKEIM